MNRNKYMLTDMWVTCLDCYHEYVKECIILDNEQEGCPVCGCKACEESGSPEEWGDY